ncbi:MAG: hypothetical protein A2X78_01650 [Gammaproteobacteria bacterium GWE2_37_16]|nr:MAG: hypothetical protein A2X78_01650 [Gammaproteobacteria bacterium GWE2_37_16]
MQQFFQFVSNHLILWSVLIFVLLALVIEELRGKLNAAPTLTAQELAILLNREEVALIDIRTNDAFRKEHIISSINNINSSKPEEFSKQLQSKKKQHIVLIDNMGTTTSALAKKLLADGFTKVSTLKDGIAAWKKAGMPTVTK